MRNNKQLLEHTQTFFLFIAFLLLGCTIYWKLYSFINPYIQQAFIEEDWQHLLLEQFDKALLHINRELHFFNGMKGFLPYFIIILFLIGGLLDPRPAAVKKKPSYSKIYSWLFVSLLFLLCSQFFLSLSFKPSYLVIAYLFSIFLGIGGLIQTINLISKRLFKKNLTEDLWNEENETFPQEEKLVENKDSINLPTEYALKGKKRQGWVNIINPFRGTLIVGTPGAGKSYFCIENFIDQQIQKGFAGCFYDWKFPELTQIVYNKWLQHRQSSYAVRPEFAVIGFDPEKMTYFSQCNPLQPKYLVVASDAISIAKAMVESMNRHAIEKQGEFFTESAQNLIAAGIWFLRLYEDGKFCSIPHLIELLLLPNAELFALMCLDKRVENFIKPFQSALYSGATNQLEGQVGTARLQFGKLSSPEIFWILSGNDVDLDVNNPEKPKILCLANNPSRAGSYSPLLSVILTSILRITNKPNQHKTSILLDEFPTIYFPDVEKFLATARSNKIATTLAVQDISQIRKGYGKEIADVIINNPANIICGQTSIETAKNISARIGNILQQKESLSQQHLELSGSISTQIDHRSAIPPARISRLSTGEFVGILADTSAQQLKQNVFHGKIINDHEKIEKEKGMYSEIPQVKSPDLVTESELMKNFLSIKEDIEVMVEYNKDRFEPWYHKLKQGEAAENRADRKRL